MPGRRPQPTHLKLIKGNPGKRRVNRAEPKAPPGMPDAPDHLGDDARREWDRVAVGLHAMGVLTLVDRGALAAYCQAYGRWVTAERALAKMAEKDGVTKGLMVKTTNGNVVQNPLVGTANKAAADMVRFAGEFGMTPSARARISMEQSAASGSKFDGLIGGAKA